MHRLAIAREDPSIREAVPANSFRSQAQAVQEANMMRAAAMAKARKMQAGAAAGAGAGAAGTGAGTGAGATAGMREAQQRSNMKSSGAAPRKLAGMNMNFQSAPAPASVPPPTPAPAAFPAPQPLLPFVFRRAAFDVQITDPASGDILQLDQGTWVLSAAAPNPRTRTLNVYTTDPDTGLVLTYELPIPDGNLNNVFDSHTLNVIETMMAHQQQVAGTDALAGSDATSDGQDEELEYGM